MKHNSRNFIQYLFRLITFWLINTLSLLATSLIIPGISFNQVENTSILAVATATSLILAVVNLLIRPLLLLIAVPFGWIIVFISGFLIDGIVLIITSAIMPGFEVSSLWTAFWGSIFMSFVNMILIMLFSIDDQDSFYENLILRKAAKEVREIGDNPGRGIVMFEIDGLGYPEITQAIENGYLPTVKELMDEYDYKVSKVDCGVPSTTPACQAGIMLGNNKNIPAFRWLDKKTNRILAGGTAAAEIEPILSDGNGLLREGSSFCNMFSGDAKKSILTFSKIKAGSPEEKKERARDLYLLMRNPYFITRVFSLFFLDVFRELWEGWQQKRKNIQPRLNRLHEAYPFLRAATNVFLREIGAYLTVLDIIRGTPVIYTLFAGYDEVAHHSGPSTKDAMLTLRHFDKTLAAIIKIIKEKAPRPYELIILSDHGQSFGATFKQRYDIDILSFIKQSLPKDASAISSGGGDDGSYTVSAMMLELENIENTGTAGKIGNSVIENTKKIFGKNLEQREGGKDINPANITLCYSGNLAHVYFDIAPRKLALDELNAAYPGMVDQIVQHEGVGFVIAYENDGVPVAFGKNGARNLYTGDVIGEDPLLPFGDVNFRSEQLVYMANFENSGDLILNSTIYPDGTVAAFEELIGSHGGIGGPQTDAFIFHPPDMEIPTTKNSHEFKAILDKRRGLPGSPFDIKSKVDEEQSVNAWSLATLLKGLGQFKRWLSYIPLVLLFNGNIYKEIGADFYMTAPALLIALIAQTLESFNSQGLFSISDIAIRYSLWLVAVLFLYTATHILRGKADYSTTLRISGFTLSAHIFELLGLIPAFSQFGHFLSLVITLFGVWYGISIVNNLKGWKTILLPLIYLISVVVLFVFIQSAISGTTLTIDLLTKNYQWLFW